MTRSPRAATSPLVASPVSSRRALIGLAALIVLGCAGSWPARGQEPGASQAVVTLESGERIVIRLLADDAPNTVSNFLGLVEARFYDGLTFHRVEDWVVQTGCPNGDGTGGPPWTITLETNDHSNVRGAVGMARVGRSPLRGEPVLHPEEGCNPSRWIVRRLWASSERHGGRGCPAAGRGCHVDPPGGVDGSRRVR